MFRLNMYVLRFLPGNLEEKTILSLIILTHQYTARRLWYTARRHVNITIFFYLFYPLSKIKCYESHVIFFNVYLF